MRQEHWYGIGMNGIGVYGIGMFEIRKKRFKLNNTEQDGIGIDAKRLIGPNRRNFDLKVRFHEFVPKD